MILDGTMKMYSLSPINQLKIKKNMFEISVTECNIKINNKQIYN